MLRTLGDSPPASSSNMIITAMNHASAGHRKSLADRVQRNKCLTKQQMLVAAICTVNILGLPLSPPNVSINTKEGNKNMGIHKL